MKVAANVEYKMLCKIVKFLSHLTCVVGSAPSNLMLKAYKLRYEKMKQDAENS